MVGIGILLANHPIFQSLQLPKEQPLFTLCYHCNITIEKIASDSTTLFLFHPAYYNEAFLITITKHIRKSSDELSNPPLPPSLSKLGSQKMIPVQHNLVTTWSFTPRRIEVSTLGRQDSTLIFRFEGIFLINDMLLYEPLLSPTSRNNPCPGYKQEDFTHRSGPPA